jgi:hypothetical protein
MVCRDRHGADRGYCSDERGSAWDEPKGERNQVSVPGLSGRIGLTSQHAERATHSVLKHGQPRSRQRTARPVLRRMLRVPLLRVLDVHNARVGCGGVPERGSNVRRRRESHEIKDRSCRCAPGEFESTGTCRRVGDHRLGKIPVELVGGLDVEVVTKETHVVAPAPHHACSRMRSW